CLCWPKIIVNGEGNGDGIREFRHHVFAALENRSLVCVNALEAVEKILRDHSSVNAKACAVEKRAVCYEKYAGIIVPNIFCMSDLFLLLGLLRRNGNCKRKKQHHECGCLGTGEPHAICLSLLI